jgi:CRISPR/Cas system endoribonuclease Cas6 (RAMP superfamily)
MKLLSFKGKEMPGFSLDFNSNVILPPYIGLGKGSSIGFGVVKAIKTTIE